MIRLESVFGYLGGAIAWVPFIVSRCASSREMAPRDHDRARGIAGDHGRVDGELTARAGVRQFETAILSAMLAGSIAPLVVLAIAAAAFANEVEDRTLANLTLTPIPRWRIVVPKLLAAITIAGPFIASARGHGAHRVPGRLDGDDRGRRVGDCRRGDVCVDVRAAGVGEHPGDRHRLAVHRPLGRILLRIRVGRATVSIRHYAIALMHAMDARRFAAPIS